MSKVSINLLPPELESVRKAQAQKSIITSASVGFLVLTIVLALIVLIYRLVQTQEIKSWTAKVEAAKTEIQSPTNVQKEQLATAVKSRVDSIATVSQKDLPASYAYGLLSSLIPPQMDITAITVDTKGRMVAEVESTSIDQINQFFNNVDNPKSNQNKLNQVTIESFNRGKTDLMKVQISSLLPGGEK